MSARAAVTVFAFEHAVRAVARAIAPGAAADKALSAYFRAHPGLGVSDRGLVADLVYGVLRHRRSLAACAASELPRDLALAGLARLTGMNLKQFAHVLRGGEARLIARAKATSLEELPAPVRLDLPDWIWQRLLEERGQDEAARLALALREAAPLALRANTMKTTRDALLQALIAEGIGARAAPLAPHGVIIEGKPALQRHPLFLAGHFEVQDEGSQLLAELVAPRRGEMIVDFCAGAGGKTLALGAIMRSSGRLYAFDVSAARLSKFKARLARSGLSNVHPVRIDSENDARVRRLAAKIDRVLVDAPCSGTGTLRRNPELKWKQGETDIAELAVKQASILAGAARLVKPGGRLVYATCSVLGAENAAVVQAFLAAHPEFAVEPAQAILAARGIDAGDGRADGALELLPHRHGCDGFFAMAMQRAR